MNITAELLRNLNACSDAVKWMAREFPDGAELTPEVLARCTRDGWVCWLACRLSESYRYWCAGIAFREAAKQNLVLEKFSMNVNESNWQEARIAAATATAYAYAAYAADVAYARRKMYAEMRHEAERVLLNL